jgi:hypothetical protein
MNSSILSANKTMPLFETAMEPLRSIKFIAEELLEGVCET